MPTHETIVIGVGSPLMGDDGLGLVALEHLRDSYRFEPHVELVDGGTWGMNLLPFLEAARRVLILDAIHASGEPGSLVVLEGDEIPRFLSAKVSPHQIDLREVIALAEFRGTLPEELVVLGLQPEKVEMSTELGPAVSAGLARLIEETIRRLEAWGHEAHPGPSAPAGSGPDRAAPPRPPQDSPSQ